MADKLYFMIRDLYAIHTNVLSRQKDQSSQVQQQQQQRQQQQQIYCRQQQQQEQQLQQQSHQQQQQFQQQQQRMNQQLQIDQQYSQMDLPVAVTSNSLQDWTLPFYAAALRDGPSAINYEFETGMNTNNDLSIQTTNLFQLPEGFDQPLMFPSSITTPQQQNRDINQNGM
jgi:hypothetical protein